MSSSLPLHLFNFKGRMNRLSYLVYGIGSVAVGTAGVWLASGLGRGTNAPVLLSLILMAIFFVGTTWLNFSLTVKRMHDIGKPGTMLLGVILTGALLSVFPRGETLGTFLLIAFNAWVFLSPGQSESNGWGAPPSGNTNGLSAAK